MSTLTEVILCCTSGPHLDLSSLSMNPQTADYALNSASYQVDTTATTSSSVPRSLFTTINLSRNSLYCLPLSLANFTCLTTLDISENGLETLLPSASPSSTSSSAQINSAIHLPSLTSLIACNNKLRDNSLAKNFGKSFAPQLKVLNLSGNLFTTIPESIFQLDNLRSLYMGENRIKTLPKTITRLQRLKFLYLGGNQLTEIPEEVGKLTKLEALSLCENNINKLPSSIARLTNLRSLALHMNQLTTLPVEIVRLKSLIEVCSSSKCGSNFLISCMNRAIL